MDLRKYPLDTQRCDIVFESCKYIASPTIRERGKEGNIERLVAQSSINVFESCKLMHPSIPERERGKEREGEREREREKGGGPVCGDCLAMEV